MSPALVKPLVYANVFLMDRYLHGTRRELQKMGRLVNEKDLTPDQVESRKPS